MTDALSRRLLLQSGLAARLVAARPPAAAGADDDIRRAMRARIDVQKRGTGVVVAARGPEGRWTETYGTTRIGGPAIDARSIFPAPSPSKLFTSVLLAAAPRPAGPPAVTRIFPSLLLADAARRGELAIDDPLSKHLPAGVTVPAFEG